MNIVHFGEGSCEKIRRYLDSYISSELLVETNHELLRHLEHCPACSAELDARTRLRTRLKGAVERQAVPPELAVKIRERIRSRSSQRSIQGNWSRWVMAVAAMLLVGLSVGVWTVRSQLPVIPMLATRPAQDAFIQHVSEAVGGVLRLGLGDHIHCAIFRKYPKDPPTLEQMAKSMGPAYQGLIAIVKARVPEQYRIIMAHQCGYAGRRYVHLTLRNGSDLISLVIAHKQPGESLGALPVTARSSGIPVYQSAAHRFKVAGFETDQYLAFVVSDLGGKNNLQMAANLAPAVHAFLSQAQG